MNYSLITYPLPAILINYSVFSVNSFAPALNLEREAAVSAREVHRNVKTTKKITKTNNTKMNVMQCNRE